MNISDKCLDKEFEYFKKLFYGSSFNPEWPIELGINPSNIFDIGAYDFGDSIRLKQKYPNSNIYSFEADPIRYDLTSSFAKKIGINTFNKALYREDGKVSFNRCINIGKDSGSFHNNGDVGSAGSIYKYTDSCKKTHTNLIQSETVEVDSIRLDTFCKEYNIDSIDLIHMDIEGAESDVIESFGKIRPKIIYLETQNGNFENCISNDDIHNRLTSLGYNLIKDLISDRLYFLTV
jgi:FkbM family methyltransferase